MRNIMDKATAELYKKYMLGLTVNIILSNTAAAF
jgi:hypothetical protein